METFALGNQLEAEAWKLAAGEHEALAQSLRAGLDEDAEIEEAWAAETVRRIVEIENGTAKAVPIADALAQIRAALK